MITSGGGAGAYLRGGGGLAHHRGPCMSLGACLRCSWWPPGLTIVGKNGTIGGKKRAAGVSLACLRRFAGHISGGCLPLLMTSGGGGRVHLRRDRFTGGAWWCMRGCGGLAHLRGPCVSPEACGAYLRRVLPCGVTFGGVAGAPGGSWCPPPGLALRYVCCGALALAVMTSGGGGRAYLRGCGGRAHLRGPCMSPGACLRCSWWPRGWRSWVKMARSEAKSAPPGCPLRVSGAHCLRG